MATYMRNGSGQRLFENEEITVGTNHGTAKSTVKVIIQKANLGDVIAPKIEYLGVELTIDSLRDLKVKEKSSLGKYTLVRTRRGWKIFEDGIEGEYQQIHIDGEDIVMSYVEPEMAQTTATGVFINSPVSPSGIQNITYR